MKSMPFSWGAGLAIGAGAGRDATVLTDPKAEAARIVATTRLSMRSAAPRVRRKVTGNGRKFELSV